MHGHDRLALVALDDDMGALLPQLDTASLPKKPEQIPASQTFMKSRVTGECVKPIDRSEAVALVAPATDEAVGIVVPALHSAEARLLNVASESRAEENAGSEPWRRSGPPGAEKLSGIYGEVRSGLRRAG